MKVQSVAINWEEHELWNKALFKTQSEYDGMSINKESDWNLYIIVDNHLHLLSYEKLIQLTPQEIVAELNKAPNEYVTKLGNKWHLYNRKLSDDGENARYRTIDTYNVLIGFINGSSPHRGILRPTR